MRCKHRYIVVLSTSYTRENVMCAVLLLVYGFLSSQHHASVQHCLLVYPISTVFSLSYAGIPLAFKQQQWWQRQQSSNKVMHKKAEVYNVSHPWCMGEVGWLKWRMWLPVLVFFIFTLFFFSFFFFFQKWLQEYKAKPGLFTWVSTFILSL